MKKPRIHVTDHALVRYLERVQGCDLALLRAQIAAVVEGGVDLGASGVRVDGFVYKIVGATVVTVQPACEPKLSTGGVAHRNRVREADDV